MGVRVGLGTDVAGGYTTDIMSAMRQAVITSRVRESRRSEDRIGAQVPEEQEQTSAGTIDPSISLAVHWTETLYLATRGGAETLGLSSGSFTPGAAFDAQQITLIDSDSGAGIGQLDFFEPISSIDEQLVEKWWCLGDDRNRTGVWVQGNKLL